MARLFWFALGAAAGMAYASQVIDKERLNLPPGQEELAQEEWSSEQAQKPSFMMRLADAIDERADWLANMIDERVTELTDRLHLSGHELASRLRGSEGGQPGSVTMYGQPFMVYRETDIIAPDINSQADTGFESNRRPGPENTL